MIKFVFFVPSWLVCCSVTLFGSVACSRAPQQVASATPGPPDAKVKVLADAYLSAYFDRYPDQGTPAPS